MKSYILSKSPRIKALKQRLNNLSGKDWLRFSISIWRDIQKNKEEMALSHPAMFPIQLAERLIDIFTNSQEQLVVDPFVGSGSTLIAAQNKGLRAIGFDINKEYISMAKNRLENVYKSFFSKTGNIQLINDASENLDNYIPNESVDLTITSPPYWDILNRKRTADRKENRPYSNSQVDLGNITDYDEFLHSLQIIFNKIYIATKVGQHCIVIVMDIRKKSKFYPLHSDLANLMSQINFRLCDIIIWDRQKEYNNMRPLGYPYSFVVNKVHEYILVFKKEKYNEPR